MCLGSLDSGISLSLDGGGGGGNGNGGKSGVGTDDGSVVDDVVGGVGAHGLLHMDLGYVVHGLVDMGHSVDGGGGGVGVVDKGSGVGGVGHGGQGGGNLNLGGLGNDGLGDGDGGGGNDRGGGVGVVNKGSGVSVGHDGGNGLTHGVNETVLVDVLGESLEGERTKASVGGDEVTEGGGEGTGGQAGGQVGVGGRGGQGTANEGTHRNLKLTVHINYDQRANHTNILSMILDLMRQGRGSQKPLIFILKLHT